MSRRPRAQAPTSALRGALASARRAAFGALASVATLATLSTVGALVGCSDDGGDDPDAGPSPDCLEAANHSDLAFIQTKIFTPGCTFTSCHRGAAAMAGGLSLEAGVARDQLVDQPSDLDPTKVMVKPGDPANSYLMIITGKYPGVISPTVGTMPSRNPLLCQEKLDAMDRWIAAGAPST